MWGLAVRKQPLRWREQLPAYLSVLLHSLPFQAESHSSPSNSCCTPTVGLSRPAGLWEATVELEGPFVQRPPETEGGSGSHRAIKNCHQRPGRELPWWHFGCTETTNSRWEPAMEVHQQEAAGGGGCQQGGAGRRPAGQHTPSRQVASPPHAPVPPGA